MAHYAGHISLAGEWQPHHGDCLKRMWGGFNCRSRWAEVSFRLVIARQFSARFGSPGFNGALRRDPSLGTIPV